MPRREDSASAGLVPVKGSYADVRVGSLLQGSKGTLDDVWEVIDARNPEQFDYKTTPWFRVRNKASGAEASVPPRTNTYPCTFMVPEVDVDPEEEKPKLDPESVGPHKALSDQSAVDLLVRELGASEIATKDHETGIMTCPAYEEQVGQWAEYLYHIEVAHGINLDGVDTTDVAAVTTLHGAAHADTHANPRPKVGGGFPHQHRYRATAKPFGDM